MRWLTLVRQFRIWLNLGWFDVRAKYARTFFGPLWNPLVALITATVLGLVYSQLFEMNLREYFPYLFTGLTVWTLVANSIADGVESIYAARSLVRNLPIPLEVTSLATVTKNILAFTMTLPIVLLVNGILGTLSIWTLPLLVAALILLLPFLTSMTYLLGLLGARFPDLSIMIAPIILLLFLSTPVMWPVDALGSRQWLANFNPFAWIVALVRDPLLGKFPDPWQWAAVAILGLAVTLGSVAIGLRLDRPIRLRL